jgi:hypothetical protein
MDRRAGTGESADCRGERSSETRHWSGFELLPEGEEGLNEDSPLWRFSSCEAGAMVLVAAPMPIRARLGEPTYAD